MYIRNYRDLLVWQKAMDLVIEVYQLTNLLPREENYNLSSQMRRAVVSIPSNIAEGQQRKTTKELIHFLSIAKGSNAELQTQFLICIRLEYLTEKQIHYAFTLSEEISKILTKLSANLSANSDH
ncbi:four helix bundle protein [Ruminococcus sp.]|uniref:four helix bundle protein n=1 Tax=Ruminococcus sp. TaxID=41978 RepID=UPI003865E7BB